MDEKEFLQKLKENILDTDSELTLDTPLKSVEEWDSLSFVAFGGFLAANGKAFDRDALKKAQSVGDLFALVQ